MISLVVISIKTVPYNWDSMTYHLPRIMHWIQNGSINHYSTNIVRQVTSPTFAEVSNMHIYLLSGETDLYVNLLQTFSFIQSGRVAISRPTILSSIKAASYLAFKLGIES